MKKNRLVNILFILVLSCKHDKTDAIFNSMTNYSKIKSWDYNSEGGIVYTKDSFYNFYYSVYNDSIQIFSRGGLWGCKHSWFYLGDSIIVDDLNTKEKVLFVSEDSLVIMPITEDNSFVFAYKKSKRQEMQITIDSFKSLYP